MKTSLRSVAVALAAVATISLPGLAHAESLSDQASQLTAALQELFGPAFVASDDPENATVQPFVEVDNPISRKVEAANGAVRKYFYAPSRFGPVDEPLAAIVSVTEFPNARSARRALAAAIDLAERDDEVERHEVGRLDRTRALRTTEVVPLGGTEDEFFSRSTFVVFRSYLVLARVGTEVSAVPEVVDEIDTLPDASVRAVLAVLRQPARTSP